MLSVEDGGVVTANVILLLGAGFSKNWNGPLATEVSAHLTSLLQSDLYVCNLLNRMKFEDVKADMMMLVSQEAGSTQFPASIPNGRPTCLRASTM
jgi:hypothetical protein